MYSTTHFLTTTIQLQLDLQKPEGGWGVSGLAPPLRTSLILRIRLRQESRGEELADAAENGRNQMMAVD